jgi:hypothetical protein
MKFKTSPPIINLGYARYIKENEVCIIFEHRRDLNINYGIFYNLFFGLQIRVETKCWVPRNAGNVYSNSQGMRAHRLSYKLLKGELIPNYYICHHCDLKGCRNPAHLFQGSASLNRRDYQLKYGTLSDGPLFFKNFKKFGISQ